MVSIRNRQAGKSVHQRDKMDDANTSKMMEYAVTTFSRQLIGGFVEDADVTTIGGKEAVDASIKSIIPVEKIFGV